jgi:hypothetical protein
MLDPGDTVTWKPPSLLDIPLPVLSQSGTSPDVCFETIEQLNISVKEYPSQLELIGWCV